MAGAAGVMFAGLTGAASFAPFDTSRSISLLAYAVIAGIASVPGALIGGLIVTLSTLNFGNGVATGASGSAVTMVTGAGLIAAVLLAPSGLAGALRSATARFAPTRHPAGGAAPPDGASEITLGPSAGAEQPTAPIKTSAGA